MLKNLVFCTFFTVVRIIPTSAQNDSVYILPELVIHLEKHGKIESYNFNEYDKTKFLFLNDSVLKADPKIYNYSVKINDINKISFRNGNYFWRGALIGAIPGFIYGFIGLSHRPDFGGGRSKDFHLDYALLGGLIFAVPTALLGGLIGLIFPKYEDFNVYRVLDNNKRNYIKKIFIIHSSN